MPITLCMMVPIKLTFVNDDIIISSIDFIVPPLAAIAPEIPVELRQADATSSIVMPLESVRRCLSEDYPLQITPVAVAVKHQAYLVSVCNPASMKGSNRPLRLETNPIFFALVQDFRRPRPVQVLVAV